MSQSVCVVLKAYCCYYVFAIITSVVLLHEPKQVFLFKFPTSLALAVNFQHTLLSPVGNLSITFLRNIYIVHTTHALLIVLIVRPAHSI